MLCSICGSDAHGSRDCPKARSNSATGNNVAAQGVRDIAPYDACIRVLQRCLNQLESELADQNALRAQIKKIEQALKILRGGIIVSAVTVDVPDTVARPGPQSIKSREAQSKRMKDYWAARREAKATA